MKKRPRPQLRVKRDGVGESDYSLKQLPWEGDRVVMRNQCRISKQLCSVC